MDGFNPHRFFGYFAKIIPILPIIIILLGLILKFSEPKKIILPSIVPTPSVRPKADKEDFQFNLNDAFSCNFEKKDYEAKLFNKNKTVLFEIKKTAVTEYFLLKGDCYYTWINGQFSGEKKCGLTPLFLTLETFMAMNPGFKPEDFVKMVPAEILTRINLTESEIKKFVNSCLKTDVDMTKLELPTNILFKNQ